MELYFQEEDEHKFVRQVLTFSQFKEYIKVEERGVLRGRYLVGEIPEIIVTDSCFTRKIYPSYAFQVQIPFQWIHSEHKEVCVRDLYATYLQKVAWEE